MKLLIILVAAVVGVGFWFTYDHAMHVKKKAYMGDLAAQLAQELETGNSSMLIFMGDGTRSRLTEISEKYNSWRIEWRDAPKPIGDGTADFCIFFSRDSQDLIGLRIKKDSATDKFHLLGYWTPS